VRYAPMSGRRSRFQLLSRFFEMLVEEENPDAPW
jgi:hypothetical protein